MKPIIESKNGRLYIRNFPLVQAAEEVSELSADIASGSSTITVLNINKFAVNKILLIGELGGERSEIIKTHASSAPSGSTVTLASNTVYSHQLGTKVYIIEYDQIELSRATSVTGSKTLLTTTLGSGLVSIEADDSEQVYRESEYTSGYYFARYKNSIGGTFSGYSDASPYGGWDKDTVGYIVNQALRKNNTDLDESNVTFDFCIDEINECLTIIQGKIKRWPNHQSFNSVLATSAAGDYRVALPTDIYNSNTKKSVSEIRIGDGSRLRYVDPDDFEARTTGFTRAEVATQATAGATSLVLVSSNDLPDAGSVSYFIANVRYSITYTGITRSTHTLTGIPASGTGAITVTTPVATSVYAGEESGYPTIYTIKEGYVYFWPIIGEGYANKNIYADYWHVVTRVDSEMDVLDTERYDMVKQWLIWKIRCQIKNEGQLNFEDGNYVQFKEILNDAIRTLPSSRTKMIPKINGITYNGPNWKRNMRGPTKTS